MLERQDVVGAGGVPIWLRARRQVEEATERLARIPPDPRRWREVLLLLLAQNNWAHATKDKLVSHKTVADRRRFLFSFFRELRKDPAKAYRIDPRSLGRRHIEHAIDRWLERGLSPGTIQVYLSHLRVFARWIGKDGLVVDSVSYFRDPARVRRTYVATEDKSWDGKGVDLAEVLERVDRMDARVGAQLRMCDAFGLRVKEAIMLRPHLAVVGDELAVIDKPGYEAYVEVLRGSKGGRLRFVPIATDAQRAALEHAKRTVRAVYESLADPTLRLHEARRRFYYVTEKCGVTREALGVTAHGLRHGFAQRRYTDATGSPVPTFGGGAVGREMDQLGRMQASRELGHARTSITQAYLGGLMQQGLLPLPRPQASEAAPNGK